MQKVVSINAKQEEADRERNESIIALLKEFIGRLENGERLRCFYFGFVTDDFADGTYWTKSLAELMGELAFAIHLVNLEKMGTLTTIGGLPDADAVEGPILDKGTGTDDPPPPPEAA